MAKVVKQVYQMSGSITLRPATLEDAKLLLDWRNDALTRKASHNTERISEDEHLAWLRKVLSSPNVRLDIALEDNSRVGTVRAEFSNGAWELSWTVAPGERSRGIGRRMVEIAAHHIEETICAEVKADNRAARRVAEYAGMKLIRNQSGVCYYKRDPKVKP